MISHSLHSFLPSNFHFFITALATMSVTITVPNNYGWVILGAGVVPVVTSMWLGGVVMKARKEYDVKYPNL